LRQLLWARLRNLRQPFGNAKTQGPFRQVRTTQSPVSLRFGPRLNRPTGGRIRKQKGLKSSQTYSSCVPQAEAGNRQNAEPLQRRTPWRWRYKTDQSDALRRLLESVLAPEKQVNVCVIPPSTATAGSPNWRMNFPIVCFGGSGGANSQGLGCPLAATGPDAIPQGRSSDFVRASARLLQRSSPCVRDNRRPDRGRSCRG